jgi:hypothetical protein
MTKGRLEIAHNLLSKLFCHQNVFFSPQTKNSRFQFRKNRPTSKIPFFDGGGGGANFRPYHVKGNIS